MSAVGERLLALGRPMDEAIRHHVLEGILRRLPGTSDLVLRGSMLTRAWVAPGARIAADLDFLGTYPHDVAETARRFRQALSVDAGDEVVIAADSLRAQGVWLNTAFPGVRLFFRAGLGEADQSMQIDVGFNDPLIPPACLIDYPALLGPPIRLWAVRPETALAWKLHGLAEMGPQGWRPKDLLDLYLIVQSQPLDDAELMPAIEAAFVSRGYAVAEAKAVFTRPDWWELKSTRVKWAHYAQSRPGIPEQLALLVECLRARLT